MTKPVNALSLLAGLALIGSPALAAPGDILFSEGLDNNAADVTISLGTDATAAFVDYSNFSLGLANHSIPEAPNMVAGSAATSGIVLQSNLLGTASPVSVIAGATPINFSGDYRLNFDMWLNVADPIPSGGTEQGVWGIGKTNTTALGRTNRLTDGTGTFGWLATENGYGTEDAAIFENTTELNDLGDTQVGEDQPFIDAFTGNPLATLNPSPANAWTEVEVEVLSGIVTVRFNGVEFFSEASAATSGFAFAGYEDPFSSISADQDNQFGIIDNITVTEIPEPASLALMGLGGLAMLRRR